MSKPAHALPKNFVPPHEISGMPDNTPILVGFSGGADSSALLYMMVEYSKTTGAKIYAAHVNHGIRGDEADRDELHCCQIAKALGVELFVCRTDVPAYAKEMGLGMELAARDLRYEFFDNVMSKHSIPLLVTAHNANDNLETMLFNIARGCGLNGVCGIPTARKCKNGFVIRPILSMSRKEILEYCAANNISFVTDSTNVDTNYTRNMIRANIIPALQAINENAVENASRLARSLNQDRLCLESMTDWFLEGICDDASIETDKLLGAPRSVSDRAIMALYSDICPDVKLEQCHIDAIRTLCEKNVPHSKIQLPHNIDAVIENGKLNIAARAHDKTGNFEFCQELTSEENEIPQINAKIYIQNSQSNKKFYKNSILLYLDSDRICGALKVRQRIAGDKITQNGMNKSVKKLLCDKKVPLDIRNRLPVVYDDCGILAIPFIGVCDRVKTRTPTLTLEVCLF